MTTTTGSPKYYNPEKDKTRFAPLVKVFRSTEELARDVAELIVGTALSVNREDHIFPRLGFASGGTMEPIYAELREIFKRCPQIRNVFKTAFTANLDEYVGLNGDDAQSYRTYMNEQLFNAIDDSDWFRKRTYIPNGKAENLDEECANFEESLRNVLKKVHIWLVGIGGNGHIAFNEPSKKGFASETHVVKLSKSTIEANSRFFESPENVPKKAITVGIGTLLDVSQRIILVATGENKAKAIRSMLMGPVDPNCPASILMTHPNVCVVLDKDAASELTAEELDELRKARHNQPKALFE